MIRKRSKATEATYRKRRPFVEKMLEPNEIGDPVFCERCLTLPFVLQPGNHWPTRRINRATLVHEKILRSAGGSIIDKTKNTFFTLCTECHRHIHDHPRESQEQGWLKSNKKQIPEI